MNQEKNIKKQRIYLFQRILGILSIFLVAAIFFGINSIMSAFLFLLILILFILSFIFEKFTKHESGETINLNKSESIKKSNYISFMGTFSYIIFILFILLPIHSNISGQFFSRDLVSHRNTDGTINSYEFKKNLSPTIITTTSVIFPALLFVLFFRSKYKHIVKAFLFLAVMFSMILYTFLDPGHDGFDNLGAIIAFPVFVVLAIAVVNIFEMFCNNILYKSKI